jgi:NAD(P)-dependent dehydrogenase (short-subunit alcohol dehydrogenase family)
VNTWLVTGASRGLGLQISRAVLARGDRLVATARNAAAVADALGPASDRLLPLALDVTDHAQVADAVEKAHAHFGRIDVLVNNAGRGFTGALEECTDAEVCATFDINFFGLLEVTRRVLPIMRAHRSGRIVNVSSISGLMSTQGVSTYAASKFALEAASESLRAEVAPLGIHVMLVEPGAFRTDFLDASSMQFAQQLIDDYAQTAGRARARASDPHPQQPGDPAKAARAIVDVALSDAPPLRLALGTDAVGWIEKKLASVRADLDANLHVTTSTNL